MGAMTDRLLLTVEDKARRLGIERSLAWRMVRSGELPSVCMGRLVRVPERKLQAWLDRRCRDSER